MTSFASAAAASAAASADLASALAALRSAGALLVEQAGSKQQSNSAPYDPKASRRQLATAGALALLRLKAALRAAAEAADLARAGASSARADADAAALAVASLAYEARHYDREIQAAMDYASSFSEEEIDLVSLEEFWATAPAELRDKVKGQGEREAKEEGGDQQEAASPAVQKHALTLARLEHERASRVKGAAEARDAKAACEAAEAEAAQARLELAELGERVSAVVAALEAAVPPPPPPPAAAAAAVAADADAADAGATDADAVS